MNITVNSQTPTITWESLLNQIQDTKVGSEGAVSEANRNLTIAYNIDGQEKTLSISIPDDIELPTEIDPGAMDSLISKLASANIGLNDEEIQLLKDSITDTYKAAAGALSKVQNTKVSSTAVLFDLYKLMALLVEVAQQQRNAAREMRSAENQMIQHAIQSQADMQRDAAMLGLIVGVSCGALSALVSIGLLVGQGKAYSKQLNEQRTSGLEGAQAKVSMLQNANTAETAQAQFNKVSGKVGAETMNTIKTDIDARVAEPKGKFEAAKQNFNEKQTALDTATNELQAARNDQNIKHQATEQAQQELNNARTAARIPEGTSIAKAKQDYLRQCAEQRVPSSPERLAEFDRAASAEATLKDAQAAEQISNGNVSQKELAVQNARAAKNDAKTQLDTARNEYRSALHNAADHYGDEYDAALTQNKENGGVDVASAKNKMLAARAYANKELAQPGVTTEADYKADLSAAKGEAALASKSLETNTDYRDALHRIEVLTAWNAINTAFGNMLQSMTQSISGMVNSEATRAGAQQQEQQEMLDQTKDLFNQAQTLVDNVVDLLKGIIAAENQSMRDAIQA